MRPLSEAEHAFYVRDTPLARIDWKSAWDEIRLEADGAIDGEATYVVLLRAGDLEMRRHFSQESGLLLRSTAKAGAGAIEVSYADYQAVAGVRLPHLTTVDIGPEQHHIYHVEKIATGVDVDAGEFEKPGM